MQTKSQALAALLLTSVLFAGSLAAQNAGTIKGTVTDPSASVIPNASIQITGTANRTLKSDGQGQFTVTVPPGNYSVRADSKGFVTFNKSQITVSAGQVTPLDISLQIATEAQEVQVSDSAAGQVNVDPSSNVGALVLKNEDLDMLPDDPDDLQADLAALAGPGAGPNGAQFFVDGFSGGQLPPKSSIREIRINSNPFAAEFDQPGFGRIEIFTRPGTDKYHGSASLNYGAKVLDTRNPFIVGEAPGYTSKSYMGNIGGPITKKSSFQLNFNRREINEGNLINARILDNNFNQILYAGSYPTPNRLLMLNGRIDYALNASNTLVMRYTHNQNSNVGGVGGTSLPSQQTNSVGKTNEVQITETAILGTKAVDETRFQFRDSHNSTNAVASPGPGINVSGAFNGGGPPQTDPDYTFNSGYELSNFITISQGSHAIKLGGRARETSITSFSTANFNGSYTFSLGAGAVPSCLSSLAVGGYQPTSLDLYAQTQRLLSQGVPISTIIAQGCGPTQFTLSAGNPLLKVRQEDFGFFAQDDWRARPNLTVSYGLRYETQTNIRDHNDWAPRLAIAWAPGAKKNAPSKTVIRAGYGWFYSRVPIGDAQSALRNNGYNQQSYQLTASPTVVLNSYPALPSSAALGGATLKQQNINVIDKSDQGSLLSQTSIGLERSLPARTSISFNFINSRGTHVARQRDINAPIPSLYFAGSTVLPYPGFGPIYSFETSGIFKQTQFITSVNTRFNRRFSMNGYYVLGFAHTNANGLPMNQYDANLDWGRASYDKRHSGYIGGTINLPWAINAAPFITLSTGGPFNITTGKDYAGSGIFNLRPAFATAPGPNSHVITTPYGVFDTNPTSSEAFIPYNYGSGPANISANIRLSRTWGWGEKVAANPNAAGGGDGGGGGRGGGPGFGVAAGGGGMGGRGGGGRGGGGGGFGGGGGGRGGASGKKYSLTASVNARNFINHVNLGNPNGSVTSPFFGQSTALSGGGGGGGFGGGGSAAGVRRIEFNVRLSF